MHGTQNTSLIACILSAKNAYALVHARICNGAEASFPVGKASELIEDNPIWFTTQSYIV